MAIYLGTAIGKNLFKNPDLVYYSEVLLARSEQEAKSLLILHTLGKFPDYTVALYGCIEVEAEKLQKLLDQEGKNE